MAIICVSVWISINLWFIKSLMLSSNSRKENGIKLFTVNSLLYSLYKAVSSCLNENFETKSNFCFLKHFSILCRCRIHADDLIPHHRIHTINHTYRIYLIDLKFYYIIDLVDMIFLNQDVAVVHDNDKKKLLSHTAAKVWYPGVA